MVRQTKCLDFEFLEADTRQDHSVHCMPKLSDREALVHQGHRVSLLIVLCSCDARIYRDSVNLDVHSHSIQGVI